jgi:hypothetical protein
MFALEKNGRFAKPKSFVNRLSMSALSALFLLTIGLLG